jgi:hypothetical protein
VPDETDATDGVGDEWNGIAWGVATNVMLQEEEEVETGTND